MAALLFIWSSWSIRLARCAPATQGSVSTKVSNPEEFAVCENTLNQVLSYL